MWKDISKVVPGLLGAVTLALEELLQQILSTYHRSLLRRVQSKKYLSDMQNPQTPQPVRGPEL